MSESLFESGYDGPLIGPAEALRRDRILAVVRDLRNLGVPLRTLAPIVADADTFRCPDCARTLATGADWSDPTITGGERDDLCWGSGANCEADYEGAV